MTTAPALRIERRSTGIYPYLFHAGPYFWPMSPEAVQQLKLHTNEPPDAFHKRLIEIVGVTSYLRHQLEAVSAGLEDRDAEIRALQQTLTTIS